MKIKSVKYDEECLDICRPYSEPYTLHKYEELVGDSSKVNQMATILMRWNKLDPACVEDLCYVIARTQPFDFAKYRDHEVSLKSLRNKILGIKDDYIVTLADIDNKFNEE